ncbi:MAG TPA: glycosyltransferase family 87 protein [Jatrophihabitans sp.]|uniref:glycosyltransferase family 87 protein n=1 Tax=Jatrophihabitans sp. TaxID=1932789 RepID=UPI002DFFAB02|nr:glycosyltransferase family 87 protein [Jatrophihabitans sp.]
MVAAFLRLYRLRFGYAHSVADYDGGVYLGSSLELVDGRVPYRDFVLVHPPVITLLFTPLALAAKAIGAAQAMGLAKILTALAGAASVPLVGRLVRERGPVVVGLACAVTALQGDAVASAYSPLLEPWLVLFCLVGAVLAFDGGRVRAGRPLLWAGMFFGLAAATKIWALAPILAFVLVCGPRRRTYLGGMAAGFLVPVLPFLLAAPRAFVHEVLTVQLLRTTDGPRTPEALRLLHMFGSPAPTGADPSVGRAALLAGVAMIVVGLALAWLRTWRRATPLDRFALVGAVLVVVSMLVPDVFYWHYAAFSTPFLVLAAVAPAAHLQRPGRRAWSAVLALAVLGLAVAMTHRDLRSYRMLNDHAAVDAVVPPGACLVSSEASAAIAQDRYGSTDPGCPVLVDPFGTVLALTGGRTPSAAALRDPRVRGFWLALYRRADYLYLTRPRSPVVPSDAVLRAYLSTHFRIVPIRSGGTLYERVDGR